jgi:DNA modification methylase
METNIILEGDCIESMKKLPDAFINTCVTSPPYYGLRDYGEDGQIGQEETPQQYIDKMVEVFAEVRRILRDDGTLWLNLGDSYAGSGGNGYKQSIQTTNPVTNSRDNDVDLRTKTKRKDIGFKKKDLMGIPWRTAMALQEDGWYLRQDIIWSKVNSMPESVTDRCTKAHEYIFLMSKNPTYYFDYEAIRERSVSKMDREHLSPIGGKKNPLKPGSYSGNAPVNDGFRNKRSVWNVPIRAKSYEGAHFAVYPEDLITPCVLAGAPEGGIVFDPFFGAGTTGAVAIKNGRTYIGCELNPEYIQVAKNRLDPIHLKRENMEKAEGIIQSYFQF